MKKKLTILLTGFIILGALRVEAQQDFQLTLYMLNPFIYNPAIAGTANYYQIRSNHRFQWVGMTDPPITNAISAFGPHVKKDMGFGGTLLYDITGPTSKMQLNGVYAYNIALTNDIRMSMGLAAGVMQYKVDGTKIKMEDQSDDVLQQAVYSTIAPDASLGVYVWNTDFFGGFSVKQLLNNKIKTGNEDKGVSKLKSHFYLMGGYRYVINREWAIEPALIIKKVVPSPYQVEINVKAIYDKIFWGGLSFRSSDAISVVLGYTYDRKIFIGYTYDIGLSDIRKYNSGSHEVCIGYNFQNIRKKKRR
jgi:type IX secretion system PorP/SprF family membrane protein